MADKTYTVEMDGQKVLDGKGLAEAQAEMSRLRTEGAVKKVLDLIAVSERGTNIIERWSVKLTNDWKPRAPRKAKPGAGAKGNKKGK